MPRCFLYESCVARGLGKEPTDPQHSLYREGLAMWQALTMDAANLPGWSVDTLAAGSPRETSTEHDKAFIAAVQQADVVLLVAPEIDGELARLATLAETHGAQLLSCRPEGIQLAGDKWACARHWRSHQLPTPETKLLTEVAPPGRLFQGQTSQAMVLKPRDGAGSWGLERIPAGQPWPKRPDPERWIVQPECPGKAFSMACLVGPDEVWPLAVSTQNLEPKHWTYLGGETPWRGPETQRWFDLVVRALRTMPGLRGFVGVDFLGGNTPSEDWLIECNPRVTTAYLGMRMMIQANLLQLWWDVVSGRSLEGIPWRSGRYRWTIEPHEVRGEHLD